MTLAEAKRDEDNTSAAECASMRLLRADGWSPAELEMCFEVANAKRHIFGWCSCDNHDIREPLDTDEVPHGG